MLLSGCAAMVAPDKKQIEITSEPNGIHCHVEGEDGEVKSEDKKTPFFVTVIDNRYYQKVVCDNGMKQDLNNSVHGATFVNMWTFFFPVLMMIDYKTGAMFEYEDTHISDVNNSI